MGRISEFIKTKKGTNTVVYIAAGILVVCSQYFYAIALLVALFIYNKYKSGNLDSITKNKPLIAGVGTFFILTIFGAGFLISAIVSFVLFAFLRKKLK